MGLIDGLHNVPERFKRCCSSLAPPPTNNNNNIAWECQIKHYFGIFRFRIGEGSKYPTELLNNEIQSSLLVSPRVRLNKEIETTR